MTSNPAYLTVGLAELASLSITPAATSSNIVGGKKQFSATGLMTDSTIAALSSLNWISTNTSAVTISTAGLANSLSLGSSTITASSGSIKSNAVLMTVNKYLRGGAVQGVALSLAGSVSTLAGGGANLVDGFGIDASFITPTGITTDGINLYVTDPGTGLYRYGNRSIRKIVIATGEVTTLVSGLDEQGITTDGVNLYTIDGATLTIRKIVIATGAVTTLAGGGTNLDGTGTAASFNAPTGITTDGINLYVTDPGSSGYGGIFGNRSIRKIVIATGEVTTLVSGLDLQGITTDGVNLYATDLSTLTIRKIQ